jgi:hypothetical protein
MCVSVCVCVCERERERVIITSLLAPRMGSPSIWCTFKDMNRQFVSHAISTEENLNENSANKCVSKSE